MINRAGKITNGLGFFARKNRKTQARFAVCDS